MVKGCSLCQHSSLQDNQASSRVFPAHKAQGYPLHEALAPMVLVQGLHWSQLWEHHPALLKHHLTADLWLRPTPELEKLVGKPLVTWLELLGGGKREKMLSKVGRDLVLPWSHFLSTL